MTFGASSFADITAVKNEPMMGFGENIFGDIFYQSPFRGKRGSGISGQSYAVADPKNVSVNGHSPFVPDNTEHNICSLSSDTGEFHQVVNVGGELTIEFFNNHFGGIQKMSRFIVGKGDAFYIFIDG